MTFEEMQNYLNNVQMQLPESKIMNALLVCFKDTKSLEDSVRKIEKALFETQTALNELITKWNIKEGAVESDSVYEETTEASNENDSIFKDELITKSPNIIIGEE